MVGLPGLDGILDRCSGKEGPLRNWYDLAERSVKALEGINRSLDILAGESMERQRRHNWV